MPDANGKEALLRWWLELEKREGRRDGLRESTLCPQAANATRPPSSATPLDLAKAVALPEERPFFP